MKEDMFRVLMYLFENHMQGDCSISLTENMLKADLGKAGFNIIAIDQALDWLEGLLLVQETTLDGARRGSIRVYTTYEIHKLGAQAIDFLIFLEHKAILNSITRELVVDRLMAIEDQEVTLPQVKWVTFLVLFNQPDEETALACMENLVLENTVYGLH